MASYPTITLEEHYFSKVLSDPSKLEYVTQHFSPEINTQLREIGPERLSAMDAGAISMQVISHGPEASSQSPADITTANNELHAACKGNPERFAAFAALPMKYPDEAVKEFKRCINELGFVGVLLDSHLPDGRYYDDAFFHPVFAAAVELDKPVYIHPTFPTPEVRRALFDGPWDDGTAFMLSTSAWGWHSDVGLHVLRLHAAGVFDKFPSLKIVIGHMGEMWPGMLDRVNMRSGPWMKDEGKGKKKTVYEMWNENIWITTSSFFSLDPMACILRNTKPDRIMYSGESGFSWLLMSILSLSDCGLLTVFRS